MIFQKLLWTKHTIKSLTFEETTDPDCILAKVIKTAANIIDSFLVNTISKDLQDTKFSENPKTALTRPIYRKNKKKIRLQIKHQLVSLLNSLSKLYGRFSHNSLTNF